MAFSYVDKNTLKSIITDWALSPSRRGYVAPTVFLQPGKNVPAWSYYNSLQTAYTKLKYLYGEGGSNITPSGSVKLKNNGQAETIGINTDFFIAIPNSLVNVPYNFVKVLIERKAAFNMLYRFYTPHGSGPFYSVFDSRYNNIAATSVRSYSSDKLAAMDKLYQQKELIKAKYNGLVTFLNELSKKQLSQQEQQILNQASQLRMTMYTQMESLKPAVTFSYSGSGGVGIAFAPVVLWAAVTAIIAAYTLPKILEIVTKARKVHEGIDLVKFTVDKEIEIAAKVKSGELSQQQANEILKTIRTAANVGINTIEKNSKPGESVFGEIGNLAKIALIFFIVVKGSQLIKK